MKKKKDHFDTVVIIGAAAAAAYFLFFKDSGAGGGSEGGAFSAPTILTPSGETSLNIVGSGSSGTKKEIGITGLPANYFTTTFQSSYPVVMYDPKKGGNQLAVQSALQKKQVAPLPTLKRFLPVSRL